MPAADAVIEFLRNGPYNRGQGMEYQKWRDRVGDSRARSQDNMAAIDAAARFMTDQLNKAGDRKMDREKMDMDRESDTFSRMDADRRFALEKTRSAREESEAGRQSGLDSEWRQQLADNPDAMATVMSGPESKAAAILNKIAQSNPDLAMEMQRARQNQIERSMRAEQDRFERQKTNRQGPNTQAVSDTLRTLASGRSNIGEDASGPISLAEPRPLKQEEVMPAAIQAAQNDPAALGEVSDAMRRQDTAASKEAALAQRSEASDQTAQLREAQFYERARADALKAFPEEKSFDGGPTRAEVEAELNQDEDEILANLQGQTPAEQARRIRTAVQDAVEMVKFKRKQAAEAGQ